MKPSRLRAIPSVDKVLQTLGDSGLAAPDRPRRGAPGAPDASDRGRPFPIVDAVIARIRAVLLDVWPSRIQPVINGTGILVHTNFGRAPLGAGRHRRVVAASDRTTATSNTASPAARAAAARRISSTASRVLCGAEAATVVNNNAAALVLILRHFCRRQP